MNDIESKEIEYERLKYRSTGVIGCKYAIFRVGSKKYKTIDMLRGYEVYMERLANTPNADKNVKNERLIGSENIVESFLEYTRGINFRKNNVLARDLLLTASPAFFKNLNIIERKKWVQLNVQWLKDRFNSNCIYAILHKDESTWHISALIVPKFWDSKKQKYILSNSRYFDGKAKLSAWQDNYASTMQTMFKSLKRGIKFSKATHVAIRQFYTIINKQLEEKDLQQVCAKARNSELLQKKVLDLQQTLNKYSKFSEKNAREKRILLNSLDDIKKDKEIFKESIKALSEIYQIPQNSIKKVLRYVESQLNNNIDNNIEREREK